MSAVLPAVPVTRIHEHPDNVRDDLGDLSELSASIRAVGLLQPLVISEWPKVYTVIDGHRRLAAARLAGARALPCLLTKHDAPDAQLVVMLAAALHKALTPMEQARAYARLNAAGMGVKKIASATGHSVATVHSRLQLVKLPPELQEKVASGDLGLTVAEEVARNTAAGRTSTIALRTKRLGWFNLEHPLRDAAAASCTPQHAIDRQTLGGACGQCWEAAIRADERQQQGAHAEEPS
jgi:ParB/RepB/Spo0J family partition protein